MYRVHEQSRRDHAVACPRKGGRYGKACAPGANILRALMCLHAVWKQQRGESRIHSQNHSGTALRPCGTSVFDRRTLNRRDHTDVYRLLGTRSRPEIMTSPRRSRIISLGENARFDDDYNAATRTYSIHLYRVVVHHDDASAEKTRCVPREKKKTTTTATMIVIMTF